MKRTHTLLRRPNKWQHRLSSGFICELCTEWVLQLALRKERNAGIKDFFVDSNWPWRNGLLIRAIFVEKLRKNFGLIAPSSESVCGYTLIMVLFGKNERVFVYGNGWDGYADLMCTFDRSLVWFFSEKNLASKELNNLPTHNFRIVKIFVSDKFCARYQFDNEQKLLIYLRRKVGPSENWRFRTSVDFCSFDLIFPLLFFHIFGRRKELAEIMKWASNVPGAKHSFHFHLSHLSSAILISWREF